MGDEGEEEGRVDGNPIEMTGPIRAVFPVSSLVHYLPRAPRWRGDYGGKKQLWFPANYVEEVPSSPAQEAVEAVRTMSFVPRASPFTHHVHVLSNDVFPWFSPQRTVRWEHS